MKRRNLLRGAASLACLGMVHPRRLKADSLINPYRFGSAGPVTLVSDTFTDTNGTNLTAHTPDVDTVGGGWSIDQGAVDIQSNRAVNNVNSTSCYCHIDAGESDVTLTALVQTDEPATNNRNVGVFVRYVDANNWWLIRVFQTSFHLLERTAGTITTRDTVAYTIPVSTQVEIVVTVAGNDITATIAGGNELNYTSSSHNTATRHGIFVWGLTDATASVDDLLVVG